MYHISNIAVVIQLLSEMDILLHSRPSVECFCHLPVILKRLCLKENCIGAKYFNLRSYFIVSVCNVVTYDILHDIVTAFVHC